MTMSSGEGVDFPITRRYFDFDSLEVLEPLLQDGAPVKMIFIQTGRVICSHLSYTPPFSEEHRKEDLELDFPTGMSFSVACSQYAEELFAQFVGYDLHDRFCSYSEGFDHALYEVGSSRDYPSTYWWRVCDEAYYKAQRSEDRAEIDRVYDTTELVAGRLVSLYTLKAALNGGIIDPTAMTDARIKALTLFCRRAYPDDYSIYFDQAVSQAITGAAARRLCVGPYRNRITYSNILHTSMTYRELYLP